MSTESYVGTFKLGTAGAAAVAGSASAEKTFSPSAATPNPPPSRNRSRSNKNRYGCRNRSKFVDPQTWNEVCKDVGPGGFFPQTEPQTPHDSPQAFKIEKLWIVVPFTRGPEPQTSKIMSENDPVIFEVKCTDKRCRDKESEAVASGEIVRDSGMWVPVQVEN